MLSPILNLDKVRSAQECISAYDRQLNITFWNAALAERMGIAEKDAVGRSIFSLFPFAKDDPRTKFLSLSMALDQPFFFPNMIYLYTQPFTYYTQYIHPQKEHGKVAGLINIIRNHTTEEVYKQDEFLTFFEKEQKNSYASLPHDTSRAYL